MGVGNIPPASDSSCLLAPKRWLCSLISTTATTTHNVLLFESRTRRSFSAMNPNHMYIYALAIRNLNEIPRTISHIYASWIFSSFTHPKYAWGVIPRVCTPLHTTHQRRLIGVDSTMKIDVCSAVLPRSEKWGLGGIGKKYEREFPLFGCKPFWCKGVKERTHG